MLHTRVLRSTDQHASAVLSQLPTTPFTDREFHDLATGSGVADNAWEVAPMLMLLAFRGAIVRRGPKLDEWVVA